DDIDRFLFDYRRYAKSKNWDEETKYRIVVIHISDKTKTWVRKLIRSCNNKWDTLKDGIVKVINARSDEKLKINRLKNIKQEVNNDSKIDKIELDIKELVKVVRELTSNNSSTFYHSRSPNSVQSPRSQRRNDEQRDVRNEGVKIAGANIRYFEVTSGSDSSGVECLKVEIVKGEPIFNVRN
ncbi:9179_t:CDS:2, partial [Scutellospora calospora]